MTQSTQSTQLPILSFEDIARDLARVVRPEQLGEVFERILQGADVASARHGAKLQARMPERGTLIRRTGRRGAKVVNLETALTGAHIDNLRAKSTTIDSHDFIGTLGQFHRQVVTLRLAGCDGSEIASMLRCHKSTVCRALSIIGIKYLKWSAE